MTYRTQVINQFYDLYVYISLIAKTILPPKRKYCLFVSGYKNYIEKYKATIQRQPMETGNYRVHKEISNGREKLQNCSF